MNHVKYFKILNGQFERVSAEGVSRTRTRRNNMGSLLGSPLFDTAGSLDEYLTLTCLQQHNGKLQVELQNKDYQMEKSKKKIKNQSGGKCNYAAGLFVKSNSNTFVD